MTAISAKNRGTAATWTSSGVGQRGAFDIVPAAGVCGTFCDPRLPDPGPRGSVNRILA
ncbi:MAG: hypothetical protein ACRDRN_03190 [Sciscionella sp.]